MITRVANSGDFQAVFPMLWQHRLRQQQLDPALYQLHPGAERRFLRWVGEVGEDPRASLLVAEQQGRFSRQIEQFLTLKDLERIEQLAVQVRASRSESSRPMNPTTAGAAHGANPAPRASELPHLSNLEA